MGDNCKQDYGFRSRGIFGGGDNIWWIIIIVVVVLVFFPGIFNSDGHGFDDCSNHDPC